MAVEYTQPAVKMVIVLLDLWQLTEIQKAAVLGVTSDSVATAIANLDSDLSSESRQRLDILLGIHERLRLLFPRDRHLAYSWMTATNRVFGNSSPVEYIENNGALGLLKVSSYLHQAG